MNSKEKYSSCFELINTKVLVNSEYLLERERERERDAGLSLARNLIKNKLFSNNLPVLFFTKELSGAILMSWRQIRPCFNSNYKIYKHLIYKESFILIKKKCL